MHKGEYTETQNLHWVLKWQIWEPDVVLKSEIITSVMQEYRNQMQRLLFVSQKTWDKRIIQVFLPFLLICNMKEF